MTYTTCGQMFMSLIDRNFEHNIGSNSSGRFGLQTILNIVYVELRILAHEQSDNCYLGKTYYRRTEENLLCLFMSDSVFLAL
jgi:hypothetical protein